MSRPGRPEAAPLWAVGMTVLLLFAGPVSPASAAKSDSQLKQERVDVLAKKAKAAAQVDALKADSAQVSQALGALQTNVASQRQSLQAADTAARNARAAADAAKDAETKGKEVLAAAQAGVKQAAVASYVSGDAKAPPFNSADIDILVRAKAYSSLAVGRRTDAVDQLNAARKDFESLARTRQAASVAASNKLAAAQERLISLNSSLAEQQGFAEAVSSRLDATYRSTSRSPTTWPACWPHPTVQACACPVAATGPANSRSRCVERTAPVTHTRHLPLRAAHPQPGPANRCMSEAWQSTSPATAASSDLAPTRASPGSRATPPASASTTSPAKPGTGR
jgi:hypothetical protein